MHSLGDGDDQARLNRAAVPVGLRMPWSEAICKKAIDAGRPAFADLQEELPQARNDFGFRRFVTCPVVRPDGTVAGTLCGASNSAGEVTQEQLHVVRTFAAALADLLPNDAS